MTKNRRVWLVIPPFDETGNGPVLGAFVSRSQAMAFGFAHVHREGFMVHSSVAASRRPKPSSDRMAVGE